jgi:hypothetical protein
MFVGVGEMLIPENGELRTIWSPFLVLVGFWFGIGVGGSEGWRMGFWIAHLARDVFQREPVLALACERVLEVAGRGE